MKLSRAVLRKGAIALTIVIAFLVLSFYDTGYLTLHPGSALLVGDLVEIEGFPVDQEGNLFLLTVTQQKATPVLFFYSFFSNRVDLVRRELLIPPEMDLEEYFRLSREMMVNSQIKSKYVALRHANIEAEITSDGVLVEGVLPTGSAYGFLEEGDIILAINGEKVFFDEQVINAIRIREIGDILELKIKRGGEEQRVKVSLGESLANPKVPALGIWVRNMALELTAPIDININTGNIGGPSAGMMFVLEIYNRLTQEDVTRGLNIAGTGEIFWDGRIGAIGGMKQKVFAAEAKGADILFCPKDNYEEATRYATKIEVIAVSSLEEIFTHLRNR